MLSLSVGRGDQRLPWNDVHEKLKIAVVDDHALVRAGICALLNATDGVEVVGEAADGASVAALVARLQPDVVVVDLVLPGRSGLLAIGDIRQCAPKARVLVVTMFDTDFHVQEALRAGAHGYLLKENTAAELAAAVRTVASGRRYLAPAVAARAAALYYAEPGDAGSNPARGLTGRERQVLVHLAQGQTSKAIGAALCISPRTVETHRASLLRKFSADNTVELIAIATNCGVLAELGAMAAATA